MTVNSTHSVVRSVANGTNTAFNFDFLLFTDDDLVVRVGGVEIAPAEYTVAIAPGGDGGTVTFDNAPTSGAVVELSRIMVIDQQTSYPVAGPFPPQTHERALDKLTMICQQMSETVRLGTADLEAATAELDAFRAEIADAVAQIALDKVIVETLAVSADNSVSTLEALEELVGGPSAVYMRGRTSEGDGGEGLFRRDTSDLSTQIAADPLHALYVPGVGCTWVRQGVVFILPEWFGETGTTDDTAVLQAALNAASGGMIYFKKKTYSHGALTFSNNTKMLACPGTTFTAIEGLADGVKLWNIIDKTNIFIDAYGVELKGIKSEYTTGEQRHGVYMAGANKVTILGLAANDTGGDGFYIGSSGTQNYCEDVTLIDVSGDNNRRQGLSLISGKNIKVIRPKFSDTNGTNPQAGIDIEPNHNDDYLENIIIDHPVLSGNASNGIELNLANLDSTSPPVDITINCPLSIGDPIGVMNSGIGVKGCVRIIDPIVKETQNFGYVFRQCRADSVRIELIRPKAIDTNQGESASVALGAAICVYSPSGDTGAEPLGNVHIYQPEVRAEKYAAKNTKAITAVDQRGLGGYISNITIDDPVALAATVLPALYFGQTSININVSDKNRKTEWNLPNATTEYTLTSYARWVNNSLFTTNRTLPLSSTYPIGTIITFEIESTYWLIIDPVATENIRPLSAVNGKYIGSNTIGSRITIKKVSATSWRVIEQIGSWTVEA